MEINYIVVLECDDCSRKVSNLEFGFDNSIAWDEFLNCRLCPECWDRRQYAENYWGYWTDVEE